MLKNAISKNVVLVAAMSAAAIAGASTSLADFVDINVTGWTIVGGYAASGNSNALVPLPIGTQITGVEWIDLTFSTIGSSSLNEVYLSVNDSIIRAGGFWDVRPAPLSNFGGTYGPGSGVFANPGEFGSGPFPVVFGTLYVTMYDSFDDHVDGPDERISSGTIRITYSVPAPAGAAAMALGALVAARRRRGR